MAVQTAYNYATAPGVPGGIYDLYHYPVDSRINEEADGVISFGFGVVKGEDAGKGIKRPVEASTAAQFEGVIVHSHTSEHNLNGEVIVRNLKTVGVMRKGRIWAVVDPDADEIAYGSALYLITSGDNAGKFTNEASWTDGNSKTVNNLAISGGRFIGEAKGGIAPIELG